ncbi:hypothetical protein MM221_09900 [Salipaludibacillus sp. LMS25]|uniref:DUF6944 family repetitive protein n=1 Tax=Salipaludibacillus sp. LMS25 TaxID=2924031 RepID=UPI0020D042BD|nr:hypothetical protein [Salipaludibacillus sp. LMS25]UTR16794.1 hypothetical protein MM221_09900 [Salipaludibacillus sp. LMS25]
MVVDDEKLLVGAWLNAIGTIISAAAEVRALAGFDDINNRLVSIGEGLQAVGTSIAGTVPEDNPLNFAGDWIDGAGAALASIAAYLQDIDDENGVDNIRLEALGDAFQSMGAAMSALGDYVTGEYGYALGNTLESLGAGLESIGATYEIREQEGGQALITIGAIIQATGANYNALLLSRETLENRKDNPI